MGAKVKEGVAYAENYFLNSVTQNFCLGQDINKRHRETTQVEDNWSPKKFHQEIKIKKL